MPDQGISLLKMRGQCNVKNKRQLDIQEIENEIVSTSEHILLLEPPFPS